MHKIQGSAQEITNLTHLSKTVEFKVVLQAKQLMLNLLQVVDNLCMITVKVIRTKIDMIFIKIRTSSTHMKVNNRQSKQLTNL